ncbi:hypothetical protein RR46_04280 [Papilio xuthus]|uniref:Uncharacterized protein n=1 Tax=Papilio xuthus TaxID=66420 RepID=A0A194QDN9_PAPXU|nr:hypothetical protein RR46_04280 [Papilio xuthus]
MAECLERQEAAGPSSRPPGAAPDALEEPEQPERTPRDPPILYRDIDAAAEFAGLTRALEAAGLELSVEERQSLDELRQYLVLGEGSWVLGDDFLAFIGRVLSEGGEGAAGGKAGGAARRAVVRCLAAAALRDDVSLLLHQDRRHHALLAYAHRVDLLPPPEQHALALFVSAPPRPDPHHHHHHHHTPPHTVTCIVFSSDEEGEGEDVGGASAGAWSAEQEARLRQHAARLKTDTVALRALPTPPQLFTYHTDDEEGLSKSGVSMAEMEAAVMMQMCNLFAHASSSEWLLYISEWEAHGQMLANIRVTTKVCVHCALSEEPELREAGTALLYNVATKEVKTVVSILSPHLPALSTSSSSRAKKVKKIINLKNDEVCVSFTNKSVSVYGRCDRLRPVCEAREARSRHVRRVRCMRHVMHARHVCSRCLLQRLAAWRGVRGRLPAAAKCKVFDEVCAELALAALQLLRAEPAASEEHVWRACSALARLAHHSPDVPQLVAVVGPDPAAYR